VTDSQLASHPASHVAVAKTPLTTSRGKQETQLSLTNLRDAFVGQSRSPNIIIPYVRYSFLLCNSNFVFKTRRFYDIRQEKMS